MNRRRFLESSMAAAVVSSFPFRAAADEHRIERIGLQLYTVRSILKSDFEGTIARVAEIGYKEVEFAGYFDHSPKEVRAVVDRNGLTAPSCHVGYDLVENHWPETLEAAQIIGHKYVVCPWIDEKQRHEPDGYKRASELFNKAGEASAKVGIEFAYHNHNFEFSPEPAIGNRLPYDYLLANTDPRLVQFEMDLCWIEVGGKDPLTYFQRYPGRFPMVHVKDIKKLPKLAPGGPPASLDEEAKELTDVGSGVMNWKRIFTHASEAGIRHYFVEQDEPADPLESIRNSYEYLLALRF